MYFRANVKMDFLISPELVRPFTTLSNELFAQREWVDKACFAL